MNQRIVRKNRKQIKEAVKEPPQLLDLLPNPDNNHAEMPFKYHDPVLRCTHYFPTEERYRRFIKRKGQSPVTR